ncbi:MAG TPA: hypothetical protein DCZ23_08190 [Lachnospiraceae bacterium]|nr:hypothetical protein [Lachnospiraceae bacterium]
MGEEAGIISGWRGIWMYTGHCLVMEDYMAKTCKSIILAVLCAVLSVWQTGCAVNTNSAGEEPSVVPSIPPVSASPVPEPVRAGIDVSRIDGISEDFISGMDISGIKAGYDGGSRYFDFDGNELFYAPGEGQKGIFTFLKECGINWVCIRTRYGTDNLESVKEAGKLATDAGLCVLIEFCYPDFLAGTVWPEGWQDMDIEEKTEILEEYTVESLTEIADHGVDARIVQINNKIANAASGEIEWENLCTLVNGCCSAVRYVADTLEKEISVALRFTGIPGNQYSTIAAMLEENQTAYDIFTLTVSYYTGTDKAAPDFTNTMKSIAEKHGKKVMAVLASDISKLKKKNLSRSRQI